MEEILCLQGSHLITTAAHVDGAPGAFLRGGRVGNAVGPGVAVAFAVVNHVQQAYMQEHGRNSMPPGFAPDHQERPASEHPQDGCSEAGRSW
jgi:hypothetical protein